MFAAPLEPASYASGMATSSALASGELSTISSMLGVASASYAWPLASGVASPSSVGSVVLDSQQGVQSALAWRATPSLSSGRGSASANCVAPLASASTAEALASASRLSDLSALVSCALPWPSSEVG